MKKLALLLAVFAVFASAADAQALQPEPQDDIQSWHELQLTVPLSKKFDFFTGLSARIGKNTTRFNDGRYTIGFTWKPHKALSFSPYYTSIRARNAIRRFRMEHRMQLRGVYRFPFKSFGLSHRSLYEYRVRGLVTQWRYRPSLTFEKDIPKNFIPAAKFFVTEEPFYDSLTKKFSRNRFTVGISKTLSEKVAVDVYFMRQNDGFSRPGDLSVIGTTWKIKM